VKVYFAARLDIPHYQVSAEELPSFIGSINKFITNSNRQKTLEIIHLHNASDHFGSHLNLFNTLSNEMTAISEDMHLQELAERVLLTSREDNSRGNLYIDTGFCSDRSTKRGVQHGGVAVPNELKFSRERIFQEAMLGMTKLADLACQPEVKGKVFVDEERERLFAGDFLFGNRIEALRVALTNESHLLACHADDKNDLTENFQGVITYSKWFLLSDGQWWRLTIIGYSRKSIAGFFRRRDLYAPLVERIADYYEQLPKERKVIDSSLLNFEEDSKRILPHVEKSVFYSIFVHCLSLLQKKLCLSVWHVVALITNTIISETPDYFERVTNHILSLPGKALDRYRALGPADLALDFFNLVFTLKETDKTKKLKVEGQRHQPHYNTRPPESTVIASINNFFRLYKAMDHITDYLAGDSYFFCRAVAYLEASFTQTGVYGVGGLTGQHLIHISCLCGIFPAPLMDHAEIGENTNSYSYLFHWEGLTVHGEDTRQLLACTGTRLNLTASVSENLICKFGQSQVVQPPEPKKVSRRVTPKQVPRKSETKKKKKVNSRRWTQKKKSPYRDSLYRHQNLYYLSSNRQLVLVTAHGSCSIVPFIAQCCSPLSKSHAVPMGDVPLSYWERKVVPGRGKSMKNGTRKAWKEASLALDNSASRKPLRIRIPMTNEMRSSLVATHDRVNCSQEVTSFKTKGHGMERKRTSLKQGGQPKKKPRIHIDVRPELRFLSKENTKPSLHDGQTAGSKVQDLEVREIGYMSSFNLPPEIFDSVITVDINAPTFNQANQGFAISNTEKDTSSTNSSDQWTTNNLDDEEFDLFAAVGDEGDGDGDPLLENQISLVVDLCLDQYTTSNYVCLADPDNWGVLFMQQLGMKALGLPSFQKKFLKHQVHTHRIGTRKATMHASGIRVIQESSSTTPFLWDPPSNICAEIITTYYPESIVASDGKRYHVTKAKADQYCLMMAILAGDAKFLMSELVDRYLRVHEMQRVLFDPNPSKGGGMKKKSPCAVVTRATDGLCVFSFLDDRGICIGPTIASSIS
jgi:hypothetical protein